MKKIHIIAAATLAALCMSGAQAQSRNTSNSSFYAEIGYSPTEVSGAGGTAKPEAMRFLVGNEVNQNLSIEGMYITTVSKESRVGYDASVSGYGLFLKPKMALTDNIEVFARIGAMRADITASASGAHTGTDVAYGLGIQTNFTKTVYGQLDYMNTYDRGGVSAKGYTLSLGTRF